MAGGCGYSWNCSVGSAVSSEWEVTLLGTHKDPVPCLGKENDTSLCLLGPLLQSGCKKVEAPWGTQSMSLPS